MLSLMLLTAVVALAVTVFVLEAAYRRDRGRLASEGHRLRHELKQLRNYELGVLNVDESTDQLVLALDPGMPGGSPRLGRRYFLHVPEDASYHVVAYRGRVPPVTHTNAAAERLKTVQQDAAERYVGVKVWPGVSTLILQIMRTEEPGAWKVVLESWREMDDENGRQGVESSFTVTEDWVESPMLARMRLGVGAHQHSVKPGEPIQLVSLIKAEVRGTDATGAVTSAGAPGEPALGLEFWLEPVP